MIARSGNMQTAPIDAGEGHPRPVGRAVEAARCRSWSASAVEPALVRTGIMEGSDTGQKRDIVTYGHPRTQGSDRPAAGAARGVSVLQRGGRHHLRRARRGRCATASATISGAYGSDPEDRRAARRGRPPRGDRHRLGGRGAGAREQPDQAADARNTTSCCATTRTIPTCS